MKPKTYLPIDARIAPLLFLVAGCSSPSAADRHASLLRELGERGVTDLTTAKVVVRSNEGNFGSDTAITATEHFIIQGIWDTIYASRPDPYWAASGFDEIALYTSREASESAATLLLNVSGSVHLKGKTPREGFRCPGLEPFIHNLLEAEYKKKHVTSASGQGAGGHSRPATGFIDIFDGKELAGWTMIGRGNVAVEDGVLHIRGADGDGSCLCYSQRPFGDFVLELDYMVPTAAGDSGIFLRIPSDRMKEQGNGPVPGEMHGVYEVQIHDGSTARTPSGYVVDVWPFVGKMSNEPASKPPGEWNRFEITVTGQKYSVVLNGVKMHEFIGEKATDGHIGLQCINRPSEVCFRRIRIKPLDARDVPTER